MFVLWRKLSCPVISLTSGHRFWSSLVRVEANVARGRTFSVNVAGRIWVKGASLVDVGQPNGTPKSEDFEDVYQRSLRDPRGFWAEAGEALSWHRKWDRVLDQSEPPFTKWFVGGELNVCYNSVDRHVVGGLGETVAIVHDSPVTNVVRKITYRQLQQQVCEMAACLRKMGLHRGDTLLIYMPMIPETIVTMMACCRLGAIHSLVFGGFAAKELAVRINHCTPKIVVAANCGVEPNRTVQYKPQLDEALTMITCQAPKCIVFQRPQFEKASLVPDRDISWDQMKAIGADAPPVDCVPVDAQHPLYILYTSGTTGDPKGVVRPSAGHAVMLSWALTHAFGMNRGDTWWAASDLGWVVGHSFICYAPLINGLTTVLYEGKPVGCPDPGAYFRVISQHGIRGLFTVPTAMRAIRKEDPNGRFASNYRLDKLKYVFVAGEHCDNDTLEWTKGAFGVPVVDNWWQTETGSPITCVCTTLTTEVKAPKNSSGKPVPGWNLKVMREDGTEAPPGEMGRIVAKQPLPPGFMSTLYKNDRKFVEYYFGTFPGMYDTMDAGIIDSEGFVHIMSRDDDIINVAGHRLSTKALEEAMLNHPDVLECAVVGVPDPLKGQVPLGLYTLKNSTSRKSEKETSSELVGIVRHLIGPVSAFKMAIRVAALPRTRSGKIARKTIADMASNKEVKIPSTIEDASVYIDIKQALQKHGYALEAPDPTK